MSDPVERGKPKPIHPGVLAEPVRPDRSLLAIVVLAVVALAGTIALLPGSGEKAEGLLAEGRYDDAIEMLVAVEDERPLDVYESYMLFKLYMLTSQPDSAVILLEREPALQADNAWALRQLSDLYRAARDVAGEASVLRRLYDASPSEADFARLRLLYRLTGDAANEASLLARAIDAGHANTSHIERLAFLQSQPAAGGRAAVWVAPSGSFGHFAAAPPFQILALTDITAPQTTSLE